MHGTHSLKESTTRGKNACNSEPCQLGPRRYEITGYSRYAKTQKSAFGFAKNEDYKVRMLLLWSEDKALEIYNTATWTDDADKLRLAPVWEKLDAYVRPKSNQILARFNSDVYARNSCHLRNS